MDFIEGLARSNGKDTILVAVDRMTKYAHVLPLSHPFSAAQVAKEFMDSVFKLHGMPTSIISNRDKQIVSCLLPLGLLLTCLQHIHLSLMDKLSG